MPHIISSAFSSFPTKERGGALTVKSYSPLTLHAVQINVKILGFCVQVQLHLECINETTENQKVILVYPVPLQWQLQHCLVKYDGHEQYTSFETSKVFTTSEAASGVGTLSSPDGKVWRVASQYIPWEMMVGTSIYAVATYHVPLPAALRSDVFNFSLPPELFPSMERPDQTVLKYNTLFQLKMPKVLKAGIHIQVEANLFHPLRGEVQLLRQGCLAGPEEVLQNVQVKYTGDTGFALEYAEPYQKMLYQPFLLHCPVAPTLEPLRLFAEVESGDSVNASSGLMTNKLSTTTSSAAVIQAAGKYAVGISFAPLRGARYVDDINVELVFVLDSHSLESSKAMAEGLRAVLPGLPSSVHVNFLFPRDDGNDTAVFIDGSQSIEKVSTEQVTAYVEELTPQRPQTGSSRLPIILEALFSERGGRGGGPVPAGYARNIIILSDEGEKSLGASLVRSAVHHANKIRISAVGLTFSSNTEVPLLTLLARETNGVFEEADKPERVPLALVKVCAEAAVPTLTNIEISIPTEDDLPDAEKARRSFGNRLPVIPVGQQRHLYLLLPESAPSTIRVVISGSVGSMLSEFNCECDMSNPPYTSNTRAEDVLSVGLLHLTAAAARCSYLVDPDIGGGSALTKTSVDEVKQLSFACGIPSPFTHLIQRTSNVPIVASQTPQVVVTSSYVSTAATYAPTLEDHQKLLYAYDNGKKPMRASERPIAACMPTKPKRTEEFVRSVVLQLLQAALAEADVHRLIPLQQRDGSFQLTSVFANCLGLSGAALQNAVPQDCEREHWWATAVALAAAQACQSPRTILMERQAERFLRKNVAVGGADWSAWVHQAASLLSNLVKKSA